jgi:hypothetical protein
MNFLDLSTVPNIAYKLSEIINMVTIQTSSIINFTKKLMMKVFITLS